ncbi:unnamed protein product [Peniophora sp. CBMAI 1063]|nr:unnamed protein product [Peniophora sp. CBMAI 1063]
MASAVYQLYSQVYSVLRERSSLVIAIAINVLAYLAFRYWSSPWRRLPPGPSGYPLIGNMLQFMNVRWLMFETPKYGDVVYLNVVGQPTIILNTQTAASDLFDKRASIYSGRPHFAVRNDMMSGGLFMPFQTHDDQWRRQRRIIHEGFNKSAASRFHTAEVEEATRLAATLIRDPAGFHDHVRNYVSSVMLSVTYDRPLHGGPDDKALRAGIDEYIHQNIAFTRVDQFVQLVPWLAYAPEWAAKWKRDARLVFEDTTRFFMGLVDDVEARMKQGTARPCLVATLVEELDRFGVTKLEAAWSAGIMYAAGSETTSSALKWCLRVMISHPDIQKRVQAELDSVIGRERLPTVADRPNLPYTVAVLREVMRWRSGLCLGVPHTAEQDDYYQGMFIPKGTVLMANMLPCNREPAVYGDDAEIFRPKRHLDAQGRLAPAPPATKEHGHVSFGFGRRVCIGQHVANDALFAAFSVLLWVFQFSKSLDRDGSEVDLNADDIVVTGFIIGPDEYKCTITPRFAGVESIVSDESLWKA